MVKTASPTPFPTLLAVPKDGFNDYAEVTVVQVLGGITAAQFQTTEIEVLKSSVDDVLGAFRTGVTKVTSFQRRLLEERQLAAGSLTVTYKARIAVQNSGFTTQAAAASAAIATLKSTSSAQFVAYIKNRAIGGIFTSTSYAMGNVTSSSITSATDTSGDTLDQSIDKLAKAAANAIVGIAVGVTLGVIFGCLGCYVAVFYCTHKRCPNPFGKDKTQVQVIATDVEIVQTDIKKPVAQTVPEP